MDLFLTIKVPSEAIFTEKKSKFIAFAFPVTTVDEAMDHVATISKKYFDARHVCYAYMIGHERNVFRANDNGEPSGTAGKPILGQINSLTLTNVVVIVVRYFGGIKLGTSGLIAAYRQAAREALDAAAIIECHATVDLRFTFPYISMNDVMKLTREAGVSMIESTYDNTCSMTLRVELDRAAGIRERLLAIDGIELAE